MAVNEWCSFAGAVTLSAAVLALATAPAPAQTPKDLNCTGNPDIAWDLQVVGCSKAIESGRSSGKNLAAILVNRGNAYHNTGKDDAALADYNEALQLNPAAAAAYNGWLYQGQGDLDRAIADYNEAIRLDPNDAFAFNNRGGAYQAKSDPDRAIADYSEAIRLHPDAGAAFAKPLPRLR